MNNFRNKLALIIAVFGLISLLAGSSYAIFTGTINQEGIQLVKVGNVKVTLTEKNGALDLSDAKPMSDIDGFLQNKYYEFEIKNTSSTSIDYTVSLINDEDKLADYTGNILDDKYIKVGIEVNNTKSGPYTLEEIGRILNEGSLLKKGASVIKLRFWLDENEKTALSSMTGYSKFLKVKVVATQHFSDSTYVKANAPALNIGTSTSENIVEITGLNIPDFPGETNTLYYRDKPTGVKLEEGVTYILKYTATSDVEPFMVSVGCGTNAYQRDIKSLTNQTSGNIEIEFTPTATQLSVGNDLYFRPVRYTQSTTFTYSYSNVKVYKKINEDYESSNMLPIKYNESTHNWEKADVKNTNNDWYDYENSIWANAATLREYSSTTPNKVYDLSGNERHTLLVNASSYRTANGYAMNGTSDYIKTGSTSGLNYPLTYSITFKTTSTNNQILFGDYETKAAAGLYSNNQYFITSIGESTNIFATGGITQGAIYTLDIVYTSLYSAEAYLNGTKLTKSNTTNTWIWTDTNSYIGKRASGDYLNGAVYRYMVYSRELSTNELITNKNIAPGTTTGVVTNGLEIYYDFTAPERDYFIKAAPVGTKITEAEMNSMWVWIPRYKYTIFNANMDGLSYKQAQQIDITFEEGTSSTGTVTCTDSIGINTYQSEICTDSKYQTVTDGFSTYTHPAFTFGDKELTGIWISKFEISNNTTTSSIEVLPNKSAYLNQTVAGYFEKIRKMELYDNVYGFESNATAYNVTGNLTGDNNNIDTHMMKNMEWGAVAYLSQSKYGRCYDDNCEDIYHNNSGYVTGRSSGSTATSIKTYEQVNPNYSGLTDANKNSIYIASGYYTYDGKGAGSIISSNYQKDLTLGYGASTTKNIYGVYDLVGGSGNYVMMNERSSSNTFNVGALTEWTTSSHPDSKYYDEYSYVSNTWNSNSIKNTKLGDALKEVATGAVNNWNNAGWYSARHGYPGGTATFLQRGGYSSSPTLGATGIFGLYGTYPLTGIAYYYVSTSAVLVVW